MNTFKIVFRKLLEMMGMTTAGKISAEEVQHIAWLAKVELTKVEKELFTKQFNTILEYFGVINELNTEKIQPTTHVIELSSRFREDEVRPSLSINNALKNAASQERRFFKAPKII